MDIIKWRDSYNIGIKMVDEQHQKLVEILNELYIAMSAHQTKEKLANILSELKKYTIFHFGAEERLLQKHFYPDLANHKKMHKSFVDKLEEYKTRLLVGDTNLSIELGRYLKDWLLTHIQGTDKMYVHHLRTKGVE